MPDGLMDIHACQNMWLVSLSTGPWSYGRFALTAAATVLRSKPASHACSLSAASQPPTPYCVAKKPGWAWGAPRRTSPMFWCCCCCCCSEAGTNHPCALCKSCPAREGVHHSCLSLCLSLFVTCYRAGGPESDTEAAATAVTEMET